MPINRLVILRSDNGATWTDPEPLSSNAAKMRRVTCRFSRVGSAVRTILAYDGEGQRSDGPHGV